MFSLETTTRFDDELLIILDFIALDSPNRALEFYDTLLLKLNNIPENPFMYRKRENLVHYPLLINSNSYKHFVEKKHFCLYANSLSKLYLVGLKEFQGKRQKFFYILSFLHD